LQTGLRNILFGLISTSRGCELMRNYLGSLVGGLIIDCTYLSTANPGSNGCCPKLATSWTDLIVAGGEKADKSPKQCTVAMVSEE
jgi:hypothetical protein